MRARLQHKGDSASQLLAAGERLFASRGFLGVSVGDLVAAANVTRPVLYYHFGSKEGLYAAVTEKVVTAYEAALAQARTEAASVVDRIRRVCRAHVAVRRAWVLLGGPAGLGPGAEHRPSDSNGHLTRVARCIQALVAEGVENGELVAFDVSAATLALVGAAEAVVVRWPGSQRDPLRTEDRLDKVLDVPLRGLVSQAGS